MSATSRVDFVGKLPQEVVINNLLPFINPQVTAPISKYWSKMTKECEIKSLSLIAEKICNDFEFKILGPHKGPWIFIHLDDILKKFNDPDRKADKDQIQIELVKAVQNIMFEFQHHEKQINNFDHDHFSKVLRQESIYRHIQLLQQHHEHHLLLNTLLELSPESMVEDLKLPFPMTVEQHTQIERAYYLLLAVMLGLKPIAENGDEQEFEELKQQTHLKAQEFMKKIESLMSNNKTDFIGCAPIELESLSAKQKLVLALGHFRDLLELGSRSIETHDMELSLSLMYNLKIIK